MEVDHYAVLGLCSGANLTEKDIQRAYRIKALAVHPDKSPDDPAAQEKFQQLTSSYEILKDEKLRKLFDDRLRMKREKQGKERQYDSKRRKMVSELEKREGLSAGEDKPRGDEERIQKKLQEEIGRIRAMHAKKDDCSVDKEKVLIVSWEKVGGDYTAERLREIFGKFGEVEDVVVSMSSPNSKRRKKGKAYVVMKNKEAVIAASRCVSLSNPLLVVPLLRQPLSSSYTHQINDNNLGHEAFETSVLDKLRHFSR